MPISTKLQTDSVNCRNQLGIKAKKFSQEELRDYYTSPQEVVRQVISSFTAINEQSTTPKSEKLQANAKKILQFLNQLQTQDSPYGSIKTGDIKVVIRILKMAVENYSKYTSQPFQNTLIKTLKNMNSSFVQFIKAQVGEEEYANFMSTNFYAPLKLGNVRRLNARPHPQSPVNTEVVDKSQADESQRFGTLYRPMPAPSPWAATRYPGDPTVAGSHTVLETSDGQTIEIISDLTRLSPNEITVLEEQTGIAFDPTNATHSPKKMTRFGRGSFGEVKLGRLNGQFVALKKVKGLANIKESQGEVTIQSRMPKHKNLMQISTVVTANGKDRKNALYIVMPLSPPEHNSLERIQTYLATLTPVDCYKQKIKITKGLLEAVKTMHENGLYHQDIAGRNIVLMPDGEPNLIDFGKMVESENPEITSDSIKLPLKSIPPERIKAGFDPFRADKVDDWALGVLLYELWAGEDPYGGEMNGNNVSFALESDPYQLINGMPGFKPKSEILLDAKSLVRGLMEPDPAKRLSAAEGLGMQLFQK